MIEMIVFLTGIFAGFVSGFAGGGAGLFMTPMLLLVGMPPHVAVATARVGAFGLSIGSLIRFLKSNAIVWRMVVPLTLLSIPAALIGAYGVIHIPQTYIEKIIGSILILSAAAIIYKPQKQTNSDKTVGAGTYFTFFITRILQAAFGSGIGLLVNVVYVKLMHLSLTEANATKRIPGFVVVLVSLTIFGIEGLIDFSTGAFLITGTIIGSFTGAHFALSVDPKYVTYAFSTLAAVFGILLIF